MGFIKWDVLSWIQALMKIIILSICVFIMLRNTFFSLPPTFYFPSQNTRVLYFLIFNPLAMEERNPSNRHPHFGWWKFIHESWNREEGMVMFVGCEWHCGGAQDKVRRRMEERGGTEPGVLQNGIRSQNTPVADGSTRRWKQLKGENTERTHQVQSTKHPLVFLEGIQVIRAIPGQQWDSGAQGCLWHPGWGTEPRGIEPRVQWEGWDRLSRRNLPLELPNVAPTHGLTTDHTGKASPNCLRLCFPLGSLTPWDRACVFLWVCTDPDPIMALVSSGVFASI